MRTKPLPLHVISLPDSDDVPAPLPDAPKILPAKFRAMAVSQLKAVQRTDLGPAIPELQLADRAELESADQNEGMETDESHSVLDPEARQRR